MLNDPFEIVFVCTGNRARSPLAEALYRRYSSGIETNAASYGTLDLEGLPALSQAVDAGAGLGVDLTPHRSRALRDAALGSVDLVLGFEPTHVATAVIEGGAPVDRAFLLGEIVGLLDAPSTNSNRLAHAREAVAIADARRTRSRPDPTAALDDPLGRSNEFMVRTAETIDGLVQRLLLGLFGANTEGLRSKH